MPLPDFHIAWNAPASDEIVILSEGKIISKGPGLSGPTGTSPIYQLLRWFYPAGLVFISSEDFLNEEVARHFGLSNSKL